LKVFIFTSVHVWNDTRIFYKQVTSLAKKYQVEYHCPADYTTKKIHKNLIVFGLPLWKDVKDRRVTRKILWERVKKSNAEIFHFHDPELIWIGLKIKWLLRKKVIYDIHEDYSAQILQKNWIKPHFVKLIISKVFSKFEKWACQYMDRLIFAESYYKDLFPQKLSHKFNDVLNFPLLSKKQNIESRSNDFVKIIYSGGVTKERGAFIMLDILKELIKRGVNVKLFLIGYLFDEEIINMIENDKLFCENVVTIGKRVFVDKSIIEFEHQSSDIGLAIFPKSIHYERKLLTKFYEYMYNGIPIVASNFKVWSKFIEKTKSGITVNSENIEETALKIIELINDKKLRLKISKSNSKLVSEKYNWDNQEIKLIQIYEELTHEN